MNLHEIIKSIPEYDPFRDSEGFVFVEKKARLAIDFFHECLHHVKGFKAGEPFILEPWQQAIIANLFGWIEKDTKLRRYREAFILVPRKNGKTAMCAGIGLYVFTCDGEPGAECYCAAGEKEQASLIFDHAKGMVSADEELFRRCKIYQAVKRMILNKDPLSVLAALSADVPHKHGLSSHLVIIDELHVQPNSDLVDVLVTSTGSRKQPLTIYLTTRDFDRPSTCNDIQDQAIKIRDGLLRNPRFLPVIYESSPSEDWEDREVWKRSNPNLGVSKTWEHMEEMYLKAKQRPSFVNTFKRLELNMKTQQDILWLDMPMWEECRDNYDEEDLAGEECFGGLDLSSKTDITSFVLFFPSSNRILTYFWCPRETILKRQKEDNMPYEHWASIGALKTTPGNVIDQDFIRRDINSLWTKFHIHEIGVDRWESTHLMVQLGGDGFTVVPTGQGFASLSSPSKELEIRLMGKQIHHNNNPVMNWMVSNVSSEEDAAGNIKPSKSKSTGRIDGIVSLVMALSRAGARPSVSVYETRGVVTL